MIRKLLPLLALLPFCAFAQTTYTFGANSADDFACGDANNIYEGAPFDVQNGALDIGKYDSGVHRHGIIQFPCLDDLPAGTVTSATLYAYLTLDSDAASFVYTSRRLLEDWTLAEASWIEYAEPDLAWTTAGALSNGNDRSSTTTGTSEAIGTTEGAYYELIQDSAQLRADVEDMRDTPASNFGWHIERTDASNDMNYRVFAGTAGTDGQRYYLSVTLDPGTATLSSPTPSGTIGTSTTATLGATTDQSTGDFYTVVESTSALLDAITSAQIKAGNNNTDMPADADCTAAVSTSTPSCGVTGLVASTLYYYASIQENANGDSNIVTGSFTTNDNDPSVVTILLLSE